MHKKVHLLNIGWSDSWIHDTKWSWDHWKGAYETPTAGLANKISVWSVKFLCDRCWLLYEGQSIHTWQLIFHSWIILCFPMYFREDPLIMTGYCVGLSFYRLRMIIITEKLSEQPLRRALFIMFRTQFSTYSWSFYIYSLFSTMAYSCSSVITVVRPSLHKIIQLKSTILAYFI